VLCEKSGDETTWGEPRQQLRVGGGGKKKKKTRDEHRVQGGWGGGGNETRCVFTAEKKGTG